MKVNINMNMKMKNLTRGVDIDSSTVIVRLTISSINPY